MMIKNDQVFIEHILDSIKAIGEFSEEITEKELASNRLKKSAIVREIEIIGEAAKNVSDDFKNKHKEVPWKDIIGTRDKLIHHYFGVDLGVIWRIIKVFLPDLKIKLENLTF
ncbi:MAG: DUF86 domain-containing protein [Nanoarchaeota archaeon]|nr:DUF86 domain-containing protein [Nanoarchaeota archaeon]